MAAPVPVGRCQCGCGEATTVSKQSETKRGYVKGQPVRFLPGHNIAKGNYAVDPVTQCWNWSGRSTGDRAGKFAMNGKRKAAYVHFYEAVKGLVPSGLVLDHTCRNPRCVNPEHLEAVTQAVNARRNKSVKLTPQMVAEIRDLAPTMTRVALGRQFGVAPGTISNIVHGRKWRAYEAPHLRANG